LLIYHKYKWHLIPRSPQRDRKVSHGLLERALAAFVWRQTKCEVPRSARDDKPWGALGMECLTQCQSPTCCHPERSEGPLTSSWITHGIVRVLQGENVPHCVGFAVV